MLDVRTSNVALALLAPLTQSIPVWRYPPSLRNMPGISHPPPASGYDDSDDYGGDNGSEEDNEDGVDPNYFARGACSKVSFCGGMLWNSRRSWYWELVAGGYGGSPSCCGLIGRLVFFSHWIPSISVFASGLLGEVFGGYWV